MNSVWILIIALVWFAVGYRFYGRFIEKRLRISDKNKTPASSRKEGVDFSASTKPFLLGHHFASIAGAGPIIGPILAVNYFGWVPVIIWVLLGAVLIGAMHDYSSLIASVRNKAKSVSVITKQYLNSRAGWVFGLMIWMTLVLIITVFSISSAESIVEKPDLVIPLLVITIPALLRNLWITIIFIYAFIASVAPVWVLLRPRDYLSAIQMLVILFLGVVSFLIARPIINAPSYISGGIFPVWPNLFITVACGAISGFHVLVASGTTSKQVAKESDGRVIGYGGMILEGTLAVFVTVVVIAGLTWGSGSGSFQTTLEKGWIVLFSTGFGNIVGNIVPFLSVSVAGLLGAFMVNQFILTSVDTSARLGRFVISEHLAPKLKGRILTTFITLVPAWILAITNSYKTMWRLFGSSNQLIASITMIGISAYFISKKIKVKFIIIPAVFVLITTLAALLFLTFRAGGYLATGNIALIVISMLMFFLGLSVAWARFPDLRKMKKL